MKYRRFGRTELQMPVLSTGGMRYQHANKDVPLDDVPEENQENLEATIHRSLELGINHIETARGYGSSERQLGLILPSFPREKLIVQTKIAPTEDVDELRQWFRESLERLQLDYVDLLAIHGINNQELLDLTLGPGKCLEAAREFQKEGLARHIGFSTHAPLPVILRAVEGGDFDYINVHWYYIFQNNWPAIEQARLRDMGIFIISPSDKGGMLFDPSEKLKELTAPLHPIVFNDLFCLTRDEVHTLSLGAARPGDYDLHMEAMDLYDKRFELVDPIVRRLDEAMMDAVGEEYLYHYREGLPEWNETPGNINIPIILWLRNLVKAYDMRTYAKMRYNLLGQAGHWFPGENAAKLDEVDLSEALRASPYHDKIPDLLRETHGMLGGEAVKRLTQS